MKDLCPEDLREFQMLVYDYYRENKRSFPWRETRDPYAILVSEVMLQQTQTYRVEPKYKAFLNRFPAVHDLAASSLHDVLLYWQGLGYNRRALMLKRAAEEIVQLYDGYFPDDAQTLQMLPGVGPYTASAVSTFAFDRPNVFIETNIRTVFLHHFFPDQDQVHDKNLMPFIMATLDGSSPRHWYYALMDYGAHLKKLYGNANKRSRHYTKQSRFEGSDRQIRGEILRRLLKKELVSAALIVQSMDRSPEVVEKVFAELVAEGLISNKDSSWEIASF